LKTICFLLGGARKESRQTPVITPRTKGKDYTEEKEPRTKKTLGKKVAQKKKKRRRGRKTTPSRAKSTDYTRGKTR